MSKPFTTKAIVRILTKAERETAVEAVITAQKELDIYSLEDIKDVIELVFRQAVRVSGLFAAALPEIFANLLSKYFEKLFDFLVNYLASILHRYISLLPGVELDIADIVPSDLLPDAEEDEEDPYEEWAKVGRQLAELQEKYQDLLEDYAVLERTYGTLRVGVLQMIDLCDHEGEYYSEMCARQKRDDMKVHGRHTYTTGFNCGRASVYALLEDNLRRIYG